MYEGYTAQQVAFPVRVMRELGARTLVVSNACGTLHPLWNAGEIMLIADHINLLGDNPLIGPNDDALGPRFPDMSAPYDEELRELARDVAREQKIVLREGVYVAITRPRARDARGVPHAAHDRRRRGGNVHGARGDRAGAWRDARARALDHDGSVPARCAASR